MTTTKIFISKTKHLNIQKTSLGLINLIAFSDAKHYVIINYTYLNLINQVTVLIINLNLLKF